VAGAGDFWRHHEAMPSINGAKIVSELSGCHSQEKFLQLIA
jgi:hypothetical protein